MVEEAPNLNIFNKKRIIITGHTGFKGGWLSFWLNELGADILGISLDPIHKDCIFERTSLKSTIQDNRQDIRNNDEILKIFKSFKPEIVFHLAAQPIVRESYDNPRYTFECNINGTLSILEAIRAVTSVNTAIMITTDKVYRNIETYWGYRENDPLGGYDPYSASKAACEIVIDSYRKSYFMKNKLNPVYCASVRAGNVIGGGDWQKDRLIPDCINSLRENKPIKLRNPDATRPWQHVLDALYGYLVLASKLLHQDARFAEAWNFGPEFESIISVNELARKLSQYWNNAKFTEIKIVSGQTKHEMKRLALDITKAKSQLGWKPILNLDESIKLTVDWYKSAQNPSINMDIITKDQIRYFMSKLK